MTKNAYTIGIPTRKRPKCIKRILGFIAKQTISPASVIVVEQEQNNDELYEPIAKKYALPFRYVYQEQANTPIARNTIIEETKTAVILFLDDDSEPAPEWADEMLKRFTDPTVGACVGRSETIDQKPEPDHTHTGRVDFLGNVTDGFSSTIRQDVDTVIGCNSGFSVDVVRKLGGFDPKFTGNAMREETDMSLRIKKAGYRIVFEPHAYVFHRRYQTGGARKADDRIQWYFHYFSNETYFFLKHRNVFLLPFFLLTKWQWMLRCSFGFGREVSFRSIFTPTQGIRDGLWKQMNI